MKDSDIISWFIIFRVRIRRSIAHAVAANRLEHIAHVNRQQKKNRSDIVVEQADIFDFV